LNQLNSNQAKSNKKKTKSEELNSNQAKSTKKKTKSAELNSNQAKSTKKKTKSEEKGIVISNRSFIVILLLLLQWR